MKLYIIRHCQTAGNASFKLQGAKTPGQLTERGRLQLAALKRFFSQEKIQTVYSSPLERALQTARGLSTNKPVTRPELNEIDFGDLEGTTHEETKAQEPDLFDQIFDTPTKRFPNGESLQDVQNRIQPLVKRLQGEKGNPTVVIVGHNILNRVLLATFLDIPLEACRMFKLKNASIAEIDANPLHRRLYLLHNGFASIGKEKVKE